MPNPDLSILVVDDAKAFSSAMIGRALSQAGYQDIRYRQQRQRGPAAARTTPGRGLNRTG